MKWAREPLRFSPEDVLSYLNQYQSYLEILFNPDIADEDKEAVEKLFKEKDAVTILVLPNIKNNYSFEELESLTDKMERWSNK